MIAASAIGGFLADLLKCPVQLGYLLGGVLVGPHCLAIIEQIVQIMSIAQLGSAVILFELGEFVVVCASR